MGISILSDTLTPGLARFKALFPERSWREILFPVGRLTCVSLAHQTQPFGIDKTAQAMGQHAIDNDMLGKRHGILMIAQDYMPMRKSASGQVNLFAKDGHVYAVDAAQWDPGGKRIEEYRKRYRSTTTGRIRGHPGVIAQNGRVNLLGALVVSQKAYDRWRNKAVKIVGFAKGGWAVCARVLGGVRGIPPWISHQKSAGRVIDQTEGTDDPSITIINDVRYVDRCLSHRQVERAVDIASDRIGKQLDYVVRARARKAGFAVH